MKPQITKVDKVDSKNLRVLFRLQDFFTQNSCSDYLGILFFSVWSTVLTFRVISVPHFIRIGLSQVKRLIKCHQPLNSLDALSLRRYAVTLSFLCVLKWRLLERVDICLAINIALPLYYKRCPALITSAWSIKTLDLLIVAFLSFQQLLFCGTS